MFTPGRNSAGGSTEERYQAIQGNCCGRAGANGAVGLGHLGDQDPVRADSPDRPENAVRSAWTRNVTRRRFTVGQAYLRWRSRRTGGMAVRSYTTTPTRYLV